MLKLSACFYTSLCGCPLNDEKAVIKLLTVHSASNVSAVLAVSSATLAWSLADDSCWVMSDRARHSKKSAE